MKQTAEKYFSKINSCSRAYFSEVETILKQGFSG
jgi:hypothetical protein